MQRPLSISELVGDIKHSLESKYRLVQVTGEVSNLSPSGAGHWYFTLSDSESSISCAIFKMDALRNPFLKRVKNGDQVILSGPVNVYQKRGTFQIVGKRITPAGRGDLSYQFQLLKEKLTAAGLFDEEEKIAIPKYPKKIAVITALGAAALQDFLNIYKRRSLWHNIVIVPALVQGDAAPKSIIKALRAAQEIEGVEAIVLTRGGGSLEDLWAFNNEELVYEIFNCMIPTISAVGHQVDFSLSDFVADLRCETPSAAAEVLTGAQTQLMQRLDYLGHRLQKQIESIKFGVVQRLERIHPRRMLEIIQKQFLLKKQRLAQLDIRGRLFDLTKLHENYQYLDELKMRLDHSAQRSLENRKNKVESLGRVLTSINPNNVLDRGYSFVSTDSKDIITNLKKFNKIKSKTALKIHFSDGVGEVEKR